MAYWNAPPAVKAPWIDVPVLPRGGRLTHTCSRQQCSAQARLAQADSGRRRFAAAPRLRHLPYSSGALQLRRSADICLPNDCVSHDFGSQSSSTEQQQQPEQQPVSGPESAETQADPARAALQLQHSRDQQRQRQWPWRPSAWTRISAAHIGTAAYLVLGSLVAWRYATVQLRSAAGSGFAALSLSNSFHSASQTGQLI